MIPKDIQLYSSISALSSCPQRGFLWWQMGTDAETTARLWRERESLNWRFSSNPFPLSSEKPFRRRDGKIVRARGD